ncbi:HGxxPAAW family protein [Streptomyces sp. NPDC060184]|uniref:HGxxPAAW family protein n=1 Tax=Streptomyces sp. NPDC060184 TaxID=3347064 RepID=UPI0036519ACE
MSAHGDADLGHTLAGWAGTTLAIVGVTGGGVAVCAASPLGVLLAGAVTVAAGVVTWLLHLAGWGKPSGPRPPAEWSWRVRDTRARAGHPDCLGCRMAGRRATGAGEASVPVADALTC